MKKVDAIIVGDVHYRDDQPRCRLDDFWETQKRKALWLQEIWEKYGRPVVLQTGDLFHRWNCSPRVISAVLSYFPPMTTIPGNPGRHNYFTAEGFERDALSVIAKSNTGFHVLEGTWLMPNFSVHPVFWDEEPVSTSYAISIMLTHRMILDGPSMFGGEHGLDFLKKWKEYDLIATGHNHKPILFYHDGSWLVNPGSFTRQSASETHEPRVYLWSIKENKVEAEYIPFQEGDLSREHIDEPNERNERILAFVERLEKEDLDLSTDFKSIVRELLKSDEVTNKVKAKVEGWIDGD